jgi:hypothetical protein
MVPVLMRENNAAEGVEVDPGPRGAFDDGSGAKTRIQEQRTSGGTEQECVPATA